MSLRITDSCVSCGACVWECPEQAIVPGDDRPLVVSEECTECRGWFPDPQCAVVCPVDAFSTAHEDTNDLDDRFSRRHPARTPRDLPFWRSWTR